jgi:hypothetical protein
MEEIRAKIGQNKSDIGTKNFKKIKFVTKTT